VGGSGPCAGHGALPHLQDSDDRANKAPLVRETMARGIQFDDQPRNRSTVTSRRMRFDMICAAKGIEHRLTQPNHPCANGKVERTNRTIKDATDKRFHHDSHDQLRIYLGDFMAADRFARRLKTLNGLTPYDYICKIWTSDPDSFSVNPIRQMPGLKTSEESLQRAQPLYGAREEHCLSGMNGSPHHTELSISSLRPAFFTTSSTLIIPLVFANSRG
jgi:Integrase core domain